jgi:hypothetical protein
MPISGRVKPINHFERSALGCLWRGFATTPPSAIANSCRALRHSLHSASGPSQLLI